MLRDGYRPFFPLAALLGAVVATGWGLMLAGRVPAWAPSMHAVAWIWGVYGGAVQGFLLTAYPRQNGATPPSSRAIAAWSLLHAGVWILALLGSAGLPVATVATTLGGASWAALTIWAVRVAVPSLRRGWDGTTFAVPVVLLAATIGWVVVRLGDPTRGLAVGLWLFLVPLALALLDRVLPFFSSKAVEGYDGRRRPHFAIILLGLGLVRVFVPTSGLPALGMGALLAWQWSGWRLRLRVPMIAVLHLSLAWIVAGFVTGGLGLGPPSLGTHLVTVGGLGTLLLGISMRVTLGHGGQAVTLLPAGAVTIVLVQVAALLRLGGALGWAGLLPWAAAAFAAAFVVWLWRFGPLALRQGPPPG